MYCATRKKSAALCARIITMSPRSLCTNCPKDLYAPTLDKLSGVEEKHMLKTAVVKRDPFGIRHKYHICTTFERFDDDENHLGKVTYANGRIHSVIADVHSEPYPIALNSKYNSRRDNEILDEILGNKH